ncbi:hypothetical protein [Bosea sp. MMO-172]|uniref:hypothetical protein n=1 Tax=Bosea sp. MMO-172 TaxID=3127885 RepID=UPI003016776F
MRIRASIKKECLPEFRPLIPLLDETKRLDRGTGPLVNTSWLCRRIQSALNSGEDCDQIGRAMVPARQLVASMDRAEVDRYRPYAAQLSLYDCGEPLIVVYEGRDKPDGFDPKTCEILNGKARAVRVQRQNISLPVIFISRTRARFWGMPSWARQLGNGGPSPAIGLRTRRHRLRSGMATLPQPPIATIDKKVTQPGMAIVSKRVEKARSAVGGRMTHPSAHALVLSSDGGVRAYAHRMLASRALQPRGLVDAFPEPAKPGPSTPRHQESCLLILFAKLLKALCDDQRDNARQWYDDSRLLRRWGGTEDLRLLMREFLGLPGDEVSLACPEQKALVDDALHEYARAARSALAKAGPSWNAPLSERLLLFGATRNPKSVKESEKKDVLRRHYLELLEWTLRALFRARHWRIGCKSIERLDTHDEFHKPDKHDPTLETRTVQRVRHEAVGSPRFQALTDLAVEPLLILSMHARFNPFLVWHDMRWAVPLGHWSMAIADLDAGRPTHVAVWMAELYEEQRRRNFEHINHFTGPATMILHWLHWVCGDVADFSRKIHEVCDEVIDGFPHRSGRLIKVVVDDQGKKTLDSEFLRYQEDWALQATLFA